MENLGVLSDREKTAATALIEEYKARWQQFLNLDNEVNKWASSYVIAMVISIGWVLGNDKVKGIDTLFLAPNNCYFILSLAVVNASYSLSVAFKGYQAQQICYYLHDVVGKELIRITGIPFNSWEVWRRIKFCSPKRAGKSEWRRSVYYPIITLLPFGVSFSILYMYVDFVGKNLSLLDPRNIYFVCAVAINLLAAWIALSTASFNKKWLMATKEYQMEGIPLVRGSQIQLQDSGNSGHPFLVKSSTTKTEH